jgi:general L-amino acid transport system permease protein
MMLRHTEPAPQPIHGVDMMAHMRPGRFWPGFRTIRSWLGDYPLVQLGVFLALVAAAAMLGQTMIANMERVGITPGFGFLARPANFEIGESLIAYSADRSFGRAIFVGFLNTLAVSLAGCVLATILGGLLGIGRLSANPLLAGAVRTYVEVVRNTPLLLQLFFWIATIRALPAAREAFNPLPGVLLSNRGVFLPAIRFGAGWEAPLFIAVLAGLLVWGLWVKRRLLRRLVLGIAATGALFAGAAMIMLPDGARMDIPELKGFNIAGGISLTPEFAALLIGLTVNAAANIAEIVRSGIEAVRRTQWETARSLGFSEMQVLRYVVLPQALRVIVPLMTSAFLNLTKNSSLAVAIGYPDLVSIVNTTANQTGQALEAILIMMIVYLTISLTVSLLMNSYNARTDWKAGA